MSSESQVAQLQDLLARVQKNRVRLEELRNAPAPEPAVEVAPEAVQPAPKPAAAAPVLPAPMPPAPALPAPVAAVQPIEPEPQLEPLPDEPPMIVSEPFADVASTRPLPLVAAAPMARPELEKRKVQGKAVASGPIAEVTGSLTVQRSWSLDAVLFRAWRLGRGGSR
jgi:hypothetical protein